MTLLHMVPFRKTALASFIGLCISQSAFALQEISDESLSETTGEGIALLPENFMMVFQGANDNPATMAADSANRSKDTGYIRYIPVGPLTQVAQDTNKDGLVNTSDHSVGKADIYMYGLALSAADGNANNRFSNTPITSWGTPTNPWLLKVTTENNVPNFSATNPPNDTGAGNVSYLMLEAPLYSTNVAGLSAAEKSAYNLKMGLWADAFVRDPNKPEGDAAQFHLGQNYGGGSDSTRANRLRLQSVWDGFSLNGSNIKLFQTLGGATNTAGMSTSYNNTFGLAGVVRLNGGDGQNLRAGYTVASQSRTPSTWTNLSATECGQTLEVKCQFRFRERTVTDTQNGIVWTAPTAQSVLRLSTREASASDDNMLTTPATSGEMPTFDPSEGLYLYNANFNLVLGSLYQPLTFGVAPDNKNLVFELARIPNKATIYKQIYTAYAGATGTLTPEQIAEYKGSTCNIYVCGNNGMTGYQGNNATHSSITIGSTEYDAGTNRVTAYKGMESVGVSFGQLATQNIATASKTRYEVGFQQRQKTVVTGQFLDRYALKDDGWTAGTPTDPSGGTSDCTLGRTCQRWWLRTGDAIHWAYLTAFNPTTGAKTWGDDAGKYTTAQLFGTLPTNVTGTRGNITNPTGTVPTYTYGLMDCTNVGDSQGVCQGTSGVGSDEGIYGLGVALRLASADNLNWVFGTRSDANTNDNKWFDANQDNSARAIYKEYYPTKSVETVPTAISAVNASPANNFGSAVIDGLLIQHMKITTKGL